MLHRRVGTIWTSSGCAVCVRPRPTSRVDRSLRLAVVSRGMAPPSPSRPRRHRTEPADPVAHLHRSGENGSDRHDAKELVAGGGRPAPPRRGAANARRGEWGGVVRAKTHSAGDEGGPAYASIRPLGAASFG